MNNVGPVTVVTPANVERPVTLSCVDTILPVVSSFDNDIAAEELMSASTITPAAIEVALPVEVTSPVKLGILVVVVAVPVSAPIKVVAVTTPETLSCLANNVVPVTVVIPAKVETPTTLRVPDILTLSSSVSPSTSKSPLASMAPAKVVMPETLN